MSSEVDFNLLISNVIGEKRFSHCRLCLKSLKNAYVRFEDSVVVAKYEFESLSEILESLLGNGICEDIPAVEAVCMDCADMALKCYKFLAQCRGSTQILHRILDNLSATLNIDITEEDKDKRLYIMIKGEVSKAIFLDKTVESSVDNKQNQCNQCDESFPSRKNLVRHCIDKHNGVGNDKEEIKNEYDVDYSIENNRIFENVSKTPKYDQKDDLRERKSLFICKSCGKWFNNFRNLHAHERKHEMRLYDCPKCEKKYLTKESYKKHVQLCLENQIEPHPFRKIQKIYCCSECDKGYSTPGGLRVHHRFAHQNEKPHFCQFCNKAFTAPSYLKAHLIKHTREKKFECHICHKHFMSKNALLYHVRRHTGEKPVVCNLCNERFVNASARAEHIKFKHNYPTQTCPICNKKFFTASFLRQHMSRHHDPSSKLYMERNLLPPNMPGEQNKRVKILTNEQVHILRECQNEN